MRIPASLSTALAILVASSAAQATVIFQTDFEAPAYTTGALAGQNGWATFGSSAAVSVESAGAIAGAQSAKITGSLAAGQSGPFHVDPSAISKLTLSADILLTSGSAERSWQFAAIGAGLVGFTGGIDIDAVSGNIRAITSGFTSIGTFTRDTVHRIDILLDYDTDLYDVKLDGALLAGGLAFCGDNGPCGGAGPGLSYAALIFDTFGAAGDDAGYIDNILVQSTPVPEPATPGLAALALLAAAFARRARGLSS